jgi:hypothetical protein
MYKVHSYITISVYISALRSLVPKTSGDIAEPHFTEILINVDENTIVRHGNIDIPLLNATAVLDIYKYSRTFLIFIRMHSQES